MYVAVQPNSSDQRKSKGIALSAQLLSPQHPSGCCRMRLSSPIPSR